MAGLRSKASDSKKQYNSKSLDNYRRRFGGYTADHFWVILRPEQREQKYDALTGILSTQERRILDSIKGLAQTGELLLEQLYHVHHERIKTDQATLKTTDDVVRVVDDYFAVDDQEFGRAKDPFSDVLLTVVVALGVDKPGDLKLKFTSHAIERDCQRELNRLRENFPLEISLETFVLVRFFRNIPAGDMKKLWNHSVTNGHNPPQAATKSGAARRARKAVKSNGVIFYQLLERTLGWIGQLVSRKNGGFEFRGTTPLPLTCGHSSLILLVCILVWIMEGTAESALANEDLASILLTTLFEWSDSDDDLTHFPVLAIVQNLWPKSVIPSDVALVQAQGVVYHLMEQPTVWERGVTLFQQFTQKFISTMQEAGTIDAATVTNLNARRDEINETLFMWVVKVLPVSEAYRIAHTTLLPREFTTLQGFDQLVDEHGQNFKTWMEHDRMLKVPEERRGDQQTKFVPVKADATYQETNVEIEKRETLKEGMERAIATNFSEKPWPSHLWPDESELEPPPPPEKDFSNQQVTLFMLDCEGLSFQPIIRKLRFACAVVRLPDWSAYTLYTGERWQTGEGGADVIFLKNFRKRDPDHGELLGLEWLDAYYHGTLDLESPGRCLATLVKRRRIAPTRLIEDAGYLGPLWQVISKESNTYALVCDLLVNAGPELSPLRLRLPNCKPGTVVDSRFLLSESDWNIEECDISPDGGKKGTFVTAGVYEPLSIFYDGKRTNSAADENEDYMLALTLKEANWTEYSPECKTMRLKSSWYDDTSGRLFVQKQR